MPLRDADLYDEANARITDLDDETLAAAIAESLAVPGEGWIRLADGRRAYAQ